MPGSHKSEFPADATALCKRIAAGDIGVREAVTATLARIDALNPALNAVVTLEQERALAEADKADAARAGGGDLPPLFGLPVTIKDAFEVAGMRSTAGAPAHADHVPERSADAVERLTKAGAIVIGKTNVPPYSADFIADNPVFGRTANPWDSEVTPGGSSGGAAAAVATGMSAFELGSDIGGSIRIPSHFCGIFGLKPTRGLVALRGHIPPAPGDTDTADLAVAGPLARSARDLDLLIDVLSGGAQHLAPARIASPKGLRVAVWLDDGYAPVGGAIGEAITTVADGLRAEGARVSFDARPDFDAQDMFATYATMLHHIVCIDLPPERRAAIAARDHQADESRPTHDALQARGAALGREGYDALQRRRHGFARAWADFFTRWDALLCPAAPLAAFPHPTEPVFLKRTLDVDGAPVPYADLMRWSAPALFGGMPATVAPIGQFATSASGARLPLGVQIVTGHGRDRDAIALAGIIGAFTPPPVAA